MLNNKTKSKKSIIFIVSYIFILLYMVKSLDDIYNIIPHSIYIFMGITMGIGGFAIFILNLIFNFNKFKRLYIIYIILICYLILNFILLNTKYIDMLLFFKDCIFFLFSAFWFYGMKTIEIRKLIKLVEKLFMIQVPIFFIQSLYYNFFYNQVYLGTVEDNIVGLVGFALTGLIGVYSAILGMKIIINYNIDKSKINKLKLIFLFLVQFIVSAKAAIIIWVFGFIYFSKFNNKNKKNFNIYIIAFLVICLIIYGILGSTDLLTLDYFTFNNIQLENILNNINYSRISRISGIALVTKYLPNNMFDFILGHGCGVTRDLKSIGLYGKDYFNMMDNQAFLGLFDSSYSQFFYEIGLVGVIIILIIIIVYYSYTKKPFSRFFILVFIFAIVYINPIVPSFFTIYFELILSLVLKEKAEGGGI